MSRSAGARRERLRAEVVAGWAAAAVTVLLVYAAVVLGIGALLGHIDSPNLGLSVLATGLVAWLAPRIHAHVEESVSRRTGNDRPAPYDVLADFTRVAGSEVGEHAPSMIARMLVQGLGLQWAQVWVLVGGELRLLATHPRTDPGEHTVPRLYASNAHGSTRTVTVAHAGNPLGVLRVKELEGRPLTSTADGLLGGLAAQAGLVLASAQLREELAVRVQELTARERELRAAREALVTTHDLERRRLERDIHDGAQQQLVALAINLRLAAALSDADPGRARTVLRAQLAATTDAVRTLSDLTEGQLPPILALAGIGAALQRATAANPVPVHVHADRVPRLPAAVGTTLYFFALEAVQNATKHAASTGIEIRIEADGPGVSVTIEDDGTGIAPGSEEGSGLANLRERAASVGGRLELGERPGGGTRIAVRVALPLPATSAQGA